MRTYDISPLSDEGMSALLWGFGAGTARLKSPLIVCRTSRLEKAYTLREVQALRGQVTLLLPRRRPSVLRFHHLHQRPVASLNQRLRLFRPLGGGIGIVILRHEFSLTQAAKEAERE